MALSNAPEIKALDEKIALLDRRLGLSQQRIEYARKKRWTNYLTLDPVRLVQNILGGGDIQRDRIAIADLEIKASDLEAQKAELERRYSEVQQNYAEQVTRLVLDIEASNRKSSLLASQLSAASMRVRIAEIDYRLGKGSTESMLPMWQRVEQIQAGLAEERIKDQTNSDQLARLCGE